MKATIEATEGAEKKMESTVLPLLIVDSLDQVNQRTNISCTCGKTENTSSMAIKSVNAKYFVISDAYCIVTTETKCHIVGILVFAKEMPTLAELNTTLKGIEEMKNFNKNITKCASDL